MNLLMIWERTEINNAVLSFPFCACVRNKVLVYLTILFFLWAISVINSSFLNIASMKYGHGGRLFFFFIIYQKFLFLRYFCSFFYFYQHLPFAMFNFGKYSATFCSKRTRKKTMKKICNWNELLHFFTYNIHIHMHTVSAGN